MTTTETTATDWQVKQKEKLRKIELSLVDTRESLAGVVGAHDWRWPRSRSLAALRPWSLAQLAGWLEEHARERGDEFLFVRVDREQRVVDAALGVTWAPAGDHWRSLGRTDELLGARPEVLVGRLVAARVGL